ncbi:MAG TPA: universal stress protein [Pyrinomonadaceae bacterium]|nr:universal stress protein [Pyrinomonadaceae bacterium]
MKILFATDGGKQSEAAIALIRGLKLIEGDEIKVISVVDMALPMAIDIYGGYIPDTGDIEKAAKENASKIVADAAAKLQEGEAAGGVLISTDIPFGSPDSRIVETAEEWGANLIVVGSHGYSRWERLLLGSVSSSVVHHAPCSVLVVRVPAEG